MNTHRILVFALAPAVLTLTLALTLGRSEPGAESSVAVAPTAQPPPAQEQPNQAPQPRPTVQASDAVAGFDPLESELDQRCAIQLAIVGVSYARAAELLGELDGACEVAPRSADRVWDVGSGTVRDAFGRYLGSATNAGELRRMGLREQLASTIAAATGSTAELDAELSSPEAVTPEQTIDLTFTLPAGQSYVQIVNLAPDGSLKNLFPTKPEHYRLQFRSGVPLALRGLEPEAPFGNETIWVISSSEPLPADLLSDTTASLLDSDRFVGWIRERSRSEVPLAIRQLDTQTLPAGEYPG